MLTIKPKSNYHQHTEFYFNSHKLYELNLSMDHTSSQKYNKNYYNTQPMINYCQQSFMEHNNLNHQQGISQYPKVGMVPCEPFYMMAGCILMIFDSQYRLLPAGIPRKIRQLVVLYEILINRDMNYSRKSFDCEGLFIFVLLCRCSFQKLIDYGRTSKEHLGFRNRLRKIHFLGLYFNQIKN